MIEQKVQSGYIEDLDKDYVFTYDGELLQLVPKERKDIRPYDFLKNSNKNLEILGGMTQTNKKIFFLNCNLQVFGSGYVARPAGYIYCNNNMDTFDTITFRSGIMDFFYRTNQIVDEEKSSCNYETGESVIKLKSFDAISKYCDVQIMGKKAILMLSITQPGLPLDLDIDYNLGKPKTILRLTFEQPVNMSEFRSVYMWVYNLMVFLNFRRDIFMGKVELGRLNEEKKVEKVASTYIIEKDKSEIANIDRIIGYYFIQEHLNELAEIVNKPELNLLFIPESDKSDKYISPEKYMVCCTSFESVFNFVFPNARTEYSQIANEVKEEFLHFISEKENEYKGKSAKKRKEFKKYSDMIKYLDFGLAEKFGRCQSQYNTIVESYKKRVLMRLSLSEKQLSNMAQLFGNKRNMLMHNSVEPFEDVHIAAYSLARAYIYVMLMKKAGISDTKVMQAIDMML